MEPSELSTSAEVVHLDVVDEFLDKDRPVDLVNYLEIMDKSKYKEIGASLFEAYKQRHSHPSRLFSGGEDLYDFNHAVKIVTDIILTTGSYKSMNKYIRMQLLNGLNKIKEQNEQNKLNEETTQFIEERWRKIKPDCLRLYSQVAEFQLEKEQLAEVIKEYEKNKRIEDSIEIIYQFEIFDVEVDWKKGIRLMISGNQFSKLPNILERKEEFIDYTMSLLSNSRYCKEASTLIDKLNLDIKKYPLVLELIQKKSVRYFVYNYLSGPDARDYMPLWKLEDIFLGLDKMLCLICESLIFNKEKKEPEMKILRFAKALALRNSIHDQLKKEVKQKLEEIEITDDDMKIDCIEDVFGPVSQPTEEFYKLPTETNVTFIGTEEEIKLAEPLLDSKCIGVDCEWRPSLTKYSITTIALLQIGDKENIYLIDMKALCNSQVLDELLTKVFTNENTDIIGMSFHNDLSGLAAAVPNLNFFKNITNLYDIQPIFSSLYNKQASLGLTKICDAVLGSKICKFEQMANWELRPLRKSQMHYGALDAYILVEIFEKMKAYAEENKIDITDYKNLSGKSCSNASEAGSVGSSNKGDSKSILKSIKLKSGQKVAPNELLSKLEIAENGEYHFCIDFNLSKLHKLFKFLGFNCTKVTKSLNIIDREKLLKQENHIFISKDERRFNSNSFSPALIIRKQDALDKQFNNIMEFFKIDKKVTLDDISLMKSKDKDEEPNE